MLQFFPELGFAGPTVRQPSVRRSITVEFDQGLFQPQSTQSIALLFRLLGESGDLIAVRLISAAVIDSPCHLFSSVLRYYGATATSDLAGVPHLIPKGVSARNLIFLLQIVILIVAAQEPAISISIENKTEAHSEKIVSYLTNP